MGIKLLAIDTAESACSAALMVDGEIHSRIEIAARSHSEKILPMMQSLLDEAGCSLKALDALAFGRGPGSFTGLRIAAGVIQGTAFAADLPVVPVSTLRALAQGANRLHAAEQVLSALDARMEEVYWGVFALDDNALMQAIGDETVCAPGTVPPVNAGNWCGAGSGWRTYEQTLRAQANPHLSQVFADLQIEAQDIARIAWAEFAAGKSVAPEHAVPVYLRDNVAKKKAV